MTRATLSVPEAAQLLGIARNTAYSEARKGELAGVPILRVSGRMLVPRAPLEAVLGITPDHDTTDDAA